MPSQLEKYALGDLSEQRSYEIEHHAEHCASCAKRLAELPVHDSIVGELRDLEAVRRRDEAALKSLRSAEDTFTTTIMGLA